MAWRIGQKLVLACLVAGLELTIGPGRAAAQEGIQADILPSEFPDDYSRGHSIGVLDRERPDYDPLGIDVGGFQLFPELGVGVGFTDNVLATASRPVADGFTAIDPVFKVQSNWNLSQVAASAGAHLREFFSRSGEDENGWFVNTDNRIDLDGYNALFVGAAADRTYEERDAGGYPANAAAPIGLFHPAAYLRGQHEVGRLRLSIAGNFDRLQFDNVPNVKGGVIIETDLSRNVWRASARAEYGLTPDAALFQQATYTRTDYTDQPPGVADRSSDDYKVLEGATFDTPSLVRGTVGIGIESRTFGSSAYTALTGVTAAAKVEYFPTDLVTATASFRRLIEDAETANSGGYFNDGADLRFDYELFRNLLLDAQGDFEQDDFADIRRTDRIASATVGARYLASNHLQLHGDLTWLHRTSSGDFVGPGIGGPVFDEVRFVVGVVIEP